MKKAVAQSVIHWEAAAAAAQAAVRKAEELGIRVNVAVVDAGGNLAAFLRMPGAFLHSIGIAQDKAYTAAGFGFPTDQWMGILEQAPALKHGIVHRERLVVFGGGLPIVHEGQVIGGIGVSEEQDVACAQAGLAALG